MAWQTPITKMRLCISTAPGQNGPSTSLTARGRLDVGRVPILPWVNPTTYRDILRVAGENSSEMSDIGTYGTHQVIVVSRVAQGLRRLFRSEVRVHSEDEKSWRAQHVQGSSQARKCASERTRSRLDRHPAHHYLMFSSTSSIPVNAWMDPSLPERLLDRFPTGHSSTTKQMERSSWFSDGWRTLHCLRVFPGSRVRCSYPPFTNVNPNLLSSRWC